MSKRKIILLSACAVLLCVFICQTILAHRNPVKNITTEIEPTKFEITGNNLNLTLTKENDYWTVGTNNYTVAQAESDAMVTAVQSISILGTADKSASSLERYDLNNEKTLHVTAFANDKILRTISIGKVSSTNSQTYICIDGGKTVYLASGNLHDTFDTTEEKLRSKMVYEINKDSISKITVQENGNTWSESKSGDPAVWSSEKVSSWAISLSQLNVSKWLSDNFELPENHVATITLSCEKEITVNIFKETIDEEEKYYGTCSESPYKFELSSYVASRFTKQQSDLK